MNRKQLHNLINRYFEAETSLAEERMLRRMLATDNAPDPLADQARAVMGVSLVTPDSGECTNLQMRQRSHGLIWRTAAAAAVIAAVATGLWLLNYKAADMPGQCVAYLNGEQISDEHAVMQLMFDDLRQIDHASDIIDSHIADDFNEISVAMRGVSR